jgi:hypothetical protein
MRKRLFAFSALPLLLTPALASAAVTVTDLGAYTGPHDQIAPASATGAYAYWTTDFFPGAVNPFGTGLGRFLAIYGGTVTFTFGTAMQSASLLWGTPESFNSVQFWNGGSLVGSITGSAFGSNSDNYFVKLTPGAVFDTIILVSSGYAFETAGLTATATTSPVAVPGPIAAAGLPGVLALIGYGLYRRRKAA